MIASLIEARNNMPGAAAQAFQKVLILSPDEPENLSIFGRSTALRFLKWPNGILLRYD